MLTVETTTLSGEYHRIDYEPGTEDQVREALIGMVWRYVMDWYTAATLSTQVRQNKLKQGASCS